MNVTSFKPIPYPPLHKWRGVHPEGIHPEGEQGGEVKTETTFSEKTLILF
jgi:hypothetical protein